MSSYGYNNPPPLRPRNPRPVGVAPLPAGYPNWSYPPPPPRSPAYIPDPPPPPIPPRPPGYEITPAESSPSIRLPPNLPIPPPPPGPPPGIAVQIPNSSPLLLQHHVSGPGQGYGYTPVPSMSPAAQNSSALTTFSPPPPGPPPRNTSSNPYGQHPYLPYLFTSQGLINNHDPRPQPSTSLLLPPSEILSLGTYTPPNETNGNRVPENGARLSVSLPPVSNPHLPGRPASPILSSAQPEDLEARLQSLTVESPLPSLARKPLYCTRHLMSKSLIWNASQIRLQRLHPTASRITRFTDTLQGSKLKTSSPGSRQRDCQH
ncbi:hypothetical protein F5Y13DRAFT_123588 [Hypoxylon sp. FL1857]|nr:hypothetical protein F5Y13DRAFT_123588 [Hypoxylon sp. FL1857]